MNLIFSFVLFSDTEPKYEKAISTVCSQFGCIYTLEAKLLAMGTTARQSANTVITKCNLPISIDQFLSLMEEQYPKVFANVELMPGAEKLVKHLHQNSIPMGIATSSKKSTFTLKSKGKEDFFKMFNPIVIGSDDPEVKRGKPNPDIFIVAANRFVNKPEKMSNVSDYKVDKR